MSDDRLVEKALDDLNRDYGGDMVDYLGPEWREILRSHIQTAVNSSTERLRGLLARLEWNKDGHCNGCTGFLYESGSMTHGHEEGCWVAAELHRPDQPEQP
ncbi:MAG TPA: hypothetical protein VK942_11370 [Actinomycetes bacterium]|nr:hypothetical protein [Actinomycetes bacterium]